MEPVSAFKITSKKFKVIDENVYKLRKDRFCSLHSDLLDVFSQTSAIVMPLASSARTKVW
jgi:hypothetical protein